VVLFLRVEGTSYYDNQVIKISSKQCVRQIGTYRYETKNDLVKTVPIEKHKWAVAVTFTSIQN